MVYVSHQLAVKTELSAEGDGGERISHVVDARDLQCEGTDGAALFQTRKAVAAPVVGREIRGGVICISFHAEGDDFGGQVFCHGVKAGRIRGNDQRALLAEELGEAAEACDDVIQILKEIQVVGIYVQNQLNRREEGEEAVCIFTRLRDECLRSADPDISPDGRENAAD